MPNLMDNTQFAQAAPQETIFDIIQRAKQDPLGFEEMVKRKNPQGYQRALQIKNSANPKTMVMEMARAQGINPSILGMLGLQ